jgi:hypothetical protein
VVSDSSEFLGGSKLAQFNYDSVNLPYISLSVGLYNITNNILKLVLQNLITFKNITLYPDSSNIINLVTIHVAEGEYVKVGNQTLCYDSKFSDMSPI